MHASGEEPLTPAKRQFLLDFGAPADSFNPECQAAAREYLRRRAEKTRHRASPELDADQVASLLGCDGQQVLDWALDKHLNAYLDCEGFRFPQGQFPMGGDSPACARYCASSNRACTPFSVEGLLADVRQEDLNDLTAVEWLAGGRSVEAVVSLAVSSTEDM